MKATNIKWDVDSMEELEYLPSEIGLPPEMIDTEEIEDYISAVTGYCHIGYVLEASELKHFKKRLH